MPGVANNARFRTDRIAKQKREVVMGSAYVVATSGFAIDDKAGLCIRQTRYSAKQICEIFSRGATRSRAAVQASKRAARG
ncbi:MULTISPECIES: hypothetical protein [unclassified Paraburkholderia]|uniref:hypothetical protein n=1 Tax=unclassified Paraburkholderia TaxID=2615204 RepID=UPI0011C05CFC|nr:MULTISPECIES: hypothetical protein [unclassified Paraburkholderia]